MSQSHGSSHASDSLCDSGQGSIYSDSGSASSDFSATSATDFNLGQLKAQMAQMLSFLRSIDTERRKCRRMRHSRNEIDYADRNFSSFQLRADEENRRSADHRKNH